MMSAPILAFICALLLAALVLAWISYCMFFREKHRSDPHYNISDIRHKNYLIAQEQDADKEVKEVAAEKSTAVGFVILPSHRKQKDEYYNKRPDYPEGAAPIVQPDAEFLGEIEKAVVEDDADIYYEDGINECTNSYSQYHSDV